MQRADMVWRAPARLAAVLLATCVLSMRARPAAAIPVFARIYDNPCGTCHTLFPQLNPQGESFRAHGFHGLRPEVEPLGLSSLFDLPGTLPIAFYIRSGENVTRTDVPDR